MLDKGGSSDLSSGADGSVPGKRKFPETNEEVIEWFRNLRTEPAFKAYPESEWESLIKKVGSNLITGDVLRTFKREHLERLDVKLLGPQTALLNRIDDLDRSFRSSEGTVRSVFGWNTEVVAPQQLKVEDICFEINSYYLSGSGLFDESTDSVMIFRRKAFDDLIGFLQDYVIERGCAGRVYGPPGTGKSLAILAFSSTLLCSEWKVTWLHFSDRDIFECIRFFGDRKMTAYLRLTDLDEILYEKEQDGSKHLMIVDGIRDSRIYPMHQTCARKCRQWFLLNKKGTSVRLVENSSMGVLDSNTEETDRMLHTETFCMFSWDQNDYKLAVNHEVFRAQIMANLDTEISEPDTEDEEGIHSQQGSDITKVEALLKAKFFFSGGSARYMFSYPTNLVKVSICKAVDSEKDVTGLLSGIIGATSSYSTHRLANCFPHPNPAVRTSCICTVVSRFAAEKLAMKAGPDAIEVLANSLRQDMNPSMEGWIFEMLFFARLRHGAVHFKDKASKKLSWPKAEEIHVLEKQTLDELQGDQIWLKPQRWNQGGYDAVFVDKSVPTVRFVQLTSGKRHGFKIRFFRKLLNQLGLKSGHVEIFFLVPSTNLKEFVISEVTGKGMLDEFSADKGNKKKWQKSGESELVRIMGMERR